MPNKVQVVIDGKPYEVDEGRHTIEQLKKKAGISDPHELDQDVAGTVTPLDQSGFVSISGGEVFVSFPPKVEIIVNGATVKIRRGTAAVADIKKHAHVAERDQLEQDTNGTLTTLDQLGNVVINGGEVFVSSPAEVSITVDGTERQIGRGSQPVSEIKRIGGVPAASQLDQDINNELTPLDQNGPVYIRGGEIFVSFPATGSSS